MASKLVLRIDGERLKRAFRRFADRTRRPLTDERIHAWIRTNWQKFRKRG